MGGSVLFNSLGFRGGLWFSLAVLLLSAGCAERGELRTTTWYRGSQVAFPTFLEKQERSREIHVQYLGESLSRDLLAYKGIPIQGAFVQEVQNQKSEKLFLKSAYFEEDLKGLDSAIERAKNEKYVQFLKFRNKFPELQAAQKIWDPHLTIDISGVRPTLVWEIDYLAPYDKGAFRMSVTLGGSVIGHRPISSHFDCRAVVYPHGPKFSDLSEVLLSNLLGNGFLMSQGVKVFNALSNQAKVVDGKFEFSPMDSRFNQLQTYYFIDEHLRYYESRHHLKLPFAIEANVNVTDPNGNPTTYTGYVHRQITLGAGDGVIWNHIPQDPSIVMHEASHAMVEALSGLSYEGEAGSLNEGYSDFLTASHLSSPLMGSGAYMKAPFKRTLENNSRLSEKNGGKYHDSLIVSGTLWEIRSLSDSNSAEGLALMSLARLSPNSNLSEFGAALRLASEQMGNQKIQSLVAQTLQRRGF